MFVSLRMQRTVLALFVVGTSLATPACSDGGSSSPELISIVTNQDVLSNSSFEATLEIGAARPPYWYIGFKGEAPLTTGTWSIDSTESSDGTSSLKLEPTGGDFFASQILHVPGNGLAGETISFTVQVKHRDLGALPTVLLVALNGEILTIDPILGIPGVAASTAGQPPATEDVWREVSGSVVLPTEATTVFITLSATGTTGAVWFDEVEIDSPGWAPDEVIAVEPEISIMDRDFEMGFTSAVPMDSSERGFENLISLASNQGTMINFFVPVQWCRLAANPVPCEDDPKHALVLARVQDAKDAGLKIGLTFGFTHATAATVGDLDPLPDGSSPGTMLDADVRTALKDELMWLFAQIDPEQVTNGIEMNIMQTLHPTWWGPFVTLHGEIYDAIKAIDPSTHVTTYHTLEWAVNDSGVLNSASADIWEMLLPKIDSIAYSCYPVGHFPSGQVAADYPDGYFSRPHDIAPDLPIMINEFGVGGGLDSGLTEMEQADLLDKMIAEFASADVRALFLYQAFDANYLGQPQWFKDLFSPIGIADLDGKVKESYFVWREIYRLPSE